MRHVNALYEYGRLHGTVRLRWSFLDEKLAARWFHRDEPTLYNLKGQALERGVPLVRLSADHGLCRRTLPVFAIKGGDARAVAAILSLSTGAEMTSATYSFKRADGRTGFLRTNTANTDARNALYGWIEKNGSRSYDLVNDDDEELVARLTFDEGDGDAGRDLERECDKVGIERNTVVSG